MATGMLLTWSGFTKEHYEKVMGMLELDAKPEPGLIFHCAGQAAGGWRVFDIWDSQEAFDRFLKDRLTPAIEKVGGIKGRPNPEFFPIHNTYVSEVKSLNTRARGMTGR